MNEQLSPAKLIEIMFEQRCSCSDEEILAELKASPVLPDEDDITSQEDWQKVYLFVALADQVAHRRLHSALLLLLERASYGDPGETMRGLCHSLEAVVEPDWGVLTDACIVAATYPQRGARLWAIAELGRLRDERVRGILVNALSDPEEEIRETAQQSLQMLDSKQ